MLVAIRMEDRIVLCLSDIRILMEDRIVSYVRQTLERRTGLSLMLDRH